MVAFSSVGSSSVGAEPVLVAAVVLGRLQGLLIAPVQRIPRYILLLKELLKWTPGESSDHAALDKALQALLSHADRMNKSKKVNIFRIKPETMNWKLSTLNSQPETKNPVDCGMLLRGGLRCCSRYVR